MSEIILFNKPYGVLTQFTGEKPEETLAAYINKPGFYAAGRLDKNSEGLLLLSNEGTIQHQLTHPKFNKKKYYWVQVEGGVTDSDLHPLRKGLKLADIHFLPAQVRIIAEPKVWTRNPPIRVRLTIPTTWIEIALQEGKNHQVRRMTAAIGFPTLRLIRHKISEWELGTLQPGDYKIITI